MHSCNLPYSSPLLKTRKHCAKRPNVRSAHKQVSRKIPRQHQRALSRGPPARGEAASTGHLAITIRPRVINRFRCRKLTSTDQSGWLVVYDLRSICAIYSSTITTSLPLFFRFFRPSRNFTNCKIKLKAISLRQTLNEGGFFTAPWPAFQIFRLPKIWYAFI